MSTNDSITSEGSRPPSEVSLHLAYAEACVVLVECLMHVMVEKNLIPKDDLIAAIENAINAKKAMADANWHREIAPVAVGVLTQIANSMDALS